MWKAKSLARMSTTGYVLVSILKSALLEEDFSLSNSDEVFHEQNAQNQNSHQQDPEKIQKRNFEGRTVRHFLKSAICCAPIYCAAEISASGNGGPSPSDERIDLVCGLQY